jgi:hypothetical protein
MMQAATACFLIAVVLLCPYCCLGEKAGSGVSHTSAIGCCCCGERGDSDNDAPQRPEEGDSDCLCRGAIFEGVRVEALDDSASLIVTPVVIAEADAPSVSVTGNVDFPCACHFPPLSTGRDLCALCCALLL